MRGSSDPRHSQSVWDCSAPGYYYAQRPFAYDKILPMQTSTMSEVSPSGQQAWLVFVKKGTVSASGEPAST
jgi:hypothetical protein